MKTYSLTTYVQQQQPTNSPGLLITLESTAVIFTIIISAVTITASFVRSVSKFNEIGEKIRNLEKSISANSNALQELRQLHLQVLGIDKKIDLHISDTTSRNQNLIADIQRISIAQQENNAEIRQLENFLQQKTDFKIRNKTNT